jgi:putative phage-type endonuclease
MKTMNNITHHVTTFDPASLPEPHNHPDRRTYLGGIDCAAILGLSPWKTPLDVYESKIAEGPQESDWNEQMYWGANLEDKILLEWERRKIGTIQNTGVFLRSKSHPWLAGTLDGIGITAPKDGGKSELVILEAKKIGSSARAAWAEGAPDHYICQVQYYMMLAGAQSAHFCVLSPTSWELYVVKEDPELQRKLFWACDAFWQNHVLAKIPPPPCFGDQYIKNENDNKSEVLDISCDDRLDAAVVNIVRLRQNIAQLELELDKEVDRLQEAGLSSKRIVMNGKTIGSWVTVNRKQYVVPASTSTFFKLATLDTLVKATQLS